MDFLIETEVPISSKFYEKADKSVKIEESDFFYTLSINRILRNSNASVERIPLTKRMFEQGVNLAKAYSSDILARKIRQNPILVKFLYESDLPFSLLGKLETLTHFPDGEEKFVKQPVLVIPGFEDKKEISGWEAANTLRRGYGLLHGLKTKYLKANQF
ncbi:hypothetical protein KY308_03010 [Candidatus Woesearchaeota archaeon]|nr:hypothetical protein [Candidatus Woesearchaeota archaeon]